MRTANREKEVHMTTHEDGEMCLLVASEETNMGGGDVMMNVTLHPVRVAANGTVRNPSSTSWPREPLADLIITAQVDRVSAESPYGWRTEYRTPYAVDLETAKLMVGALTKVERGLTKIRAELGPPETFTAYVARVAKTLGIKRFGRTAKRGRGWSHDDNEYVWMDAEGMAYHIQTLTSDFLKVNS
jgi:hypothetical protein